MGVKYNVSPYLEPRIRLVCNLSSTFQAPLIMIEAELTEFARALASLKATQDLIILMSLTGWVYRYPTAPFRVVAPNATSPVQGVTGLLSGMASASALRNVTLKLVLRTDDIGSNADWETINFLLCDDQRFPDLRTVTLNVVLVEHSLPERTDIDCIAAMNAQIQSCMPNLCSSGKLNSQVTFHPHNKLLHRLDVSVINFYTRHITHRIFQDPMYHW
jgi:hypothetical protein